MAQQREAGYTLRFCERLVTPERYQRICATLVRRQPDLHVITDRVHKPHNVSAILRSCDAMGVLNAHIVTDEPSQFSARHGIAMGSEKWIEVHLHRTVSSPIQTLQAQGVQVFAAHLSGTAVDFRDVDWTQPSAVLLGTEKFGVSETARAEVDQHIVIPMQGMVESLNVSVAAAIILSEAQRQRTVAGMYAQRRISEELMTRLAFRWGYPKVAAHCEQHGLAYPPLDEQGQLPPGALSQDPPPL